MGLGSLDNFLKNTKGEILYVDPSSLDSTDSVENQGNSLARPFKTIQRALMERILRFSYQEGRENDRFGKTTILLYPGEHIVDNRQDSLHQKLVELILLEQEQLQKIYLLWIEILTLMFYQKTILFIN